jgi:hypothetical protein
LLAWSLAWPSHPDLVSVLVAVVSLIGSVFALPLPACYELWEHLPLPAGTRIVLGEPRVDGVVERVRLAAARAGLVPTLSCTWHSIGISASDPLFTYVICE